jgi:multicomponent Na+:H+ antiporter subunit D
MNDLPPLPVAVSFCTAAFLMATSVLVSRRVRDLIAIIAAGAVTAICVLLLLQSANEPIVYWFGGWQPRNGVALGIGFVIDPLGAALAVLAAGLAMIAFIFSWRYFDEIGALYPALMLIFMGAMVGFCLSGDLFNLFVFFELMSVTAYALTGYKIEERQALMGAFNFGITNSVGAFLMLIGIGLLYGRTGALNLAQLGQMLAAGPSDGLVITALALITTGSAASTRMSYMAPAGVFRGSACFSS